MFVKSVLGGGSSFACFFQILKPPKVNFRVENEKGHILSKGEIPIGSVSNLSWPVLFVNQHGDTVFLI